MKVILRAALATLLVSLVGAKSTAADVSLERVAGCKVDPVHGCWRLLIRGQLVAGDYERLKSYLNGSPKLNAPYFLGLRLDSGGGSVPVANDIASNMFGYGRSGTVFVLGQAKYASACFLIFACAATKFVSSTAHIGVHSAGEVGGTEDTSALATDTVIARIAKKCGAPDGIVVKTLTTPADSVYWLTASELASMGCD